MPDATKFLSHLELGETDQTFLDSNELIINMGPQHPATHGVLRVILKLDGEKVLGTECVIGYLHRGVEKIAEHRTYTMFNPYVDRMDYVAAVSNGLGYCEAVEKLLNVQAPPRANYVRVNLNGKALGLYLLTEGWDKTFLKRYFKNLKGNLYDGGFALLSDTSAWDLHDRIRLR